jgi:hypothetical protein
LVVLGRVGSYFANFGQGEDFPLGKAICETLAVNVGRHGSQSPGLSVPGIGMLAKLQLSPAVTHPLME